MISTSAVRCVGNTLILQGRVYSPPFVIKAIGDVDGMRQTLDQDPTVQIIQQYVAAVGLGYDVSTQPSATFPAPSAACTVLSCTVPKPSSSWSAASVPPTILRSASETQSTSPSRSCSLQMPGKPSYRAPS